MEWSNLQLAALKGFRRVHMDNGYAGYLAFQVGEGACDTSLPGCTEPDALNFVQGANTDDGSCVYFETFEHRQFGGVERQYIYYHPACTARLPTGVCFSWVHGQRG